VKVLRSFFIGDLVEVGAVAFSPDGRYLIAGYTGRESGVRTRADTYVRRWDLETGKETWILKGHQNRVLSAAVSPDGKIGLTGGGRPSSYTLCPAVRSLGYDQ
jgi:WD40 repeat protein